MYSVIETPESLTVAEKKQRGWEYVEAINMEDRFIQRFVEEAIAVVADRLKTKRGTMVAPINNVQSLRVKSSFPADKKGISFNKWAGWRSPDQCQNVAFGKISAAVTNKIAQRLNLQLNQVTAQVDVDRVNNISRIVFHFAESVTRVPAN